MSDDCVEKNRTAPTDGRSGKTLDSADVMRRYEQARYIKSREERIKHERSKK